MLVLHGLRNRHAMAYGCQDVVGQSLQAVANVDQHFGLAARFYGDVGSHLGLIFYFEASDCMLWSAITQGSYSLLAQ